MTLLGKWRDEPGMIDSYSFGSLVIDGKRYTSDVIIYPHRVDSHWWRLQGHLLQLEDLREVLDFDPEVLIVGTGHSGLMKIAPETERFFRESPIELVVKLTEEACQTYNHLHRSKKTVVALHLTC